MWPTQFQQYFNAYECCYCITLHVNILLNKQIVKHTVCKNCVQIAYPELQCGQGQVKHYQTAKHAI